MNKTTRPVSDEARQHSIYAQLAAGDYRPWAHEDFPSPHQDDPRINAGGDTRVAVIRDVNELFETKTGGALATLTKHYEHRDDMSVLMDDDSALVIYDADQGGGV